MVKNVRFLYKNSEVLLLTSTTQTYLKKEFWYKLVNFTLSTNKIGKELKFCFKYAYGTNLNFQCAH